MSKYSTIHDLIKSQETLYLQPINVMDGWPWSMFTHIKTSLFYKHGRLLTGNDDDKPVKNIIRPILNFQYRAEDIDLKDIDIYVDDKDLFHLSFLVKKYHDEVFVKENDLDTFFDEVKEEKIDFGGSLCQRVAGVRPEKIPLQNIAFCNQKNILSSPFGLKYSYSPDELKDMEDLHWGDENHGATCTIDELILLSSKDGISDIEIYVTRGRLPVSWLDDSRGDDGTYSYQMHVTAFYKDENGDKQGVTLFRSKYDKNNLKFITRDKIENRGLGYGGAEELFEDQVWMNYSEIRKKDLIDAAAKTILKKVGPGSIDKSKIRDMDNLEVVDLPEGTDIGVLDTTPRSIAIFERWSDELLAHAQMTGSAGDAVLGKSPSSGTPFKLQDVVIAENHGLSEYRRGKYASFVEEVYRDWFIPYISQEIVKGKKFLSDLSADELEYVAECMANRAWNKIAINKIFKDQDVTEEEKNLFKEQFKRDIAKGGTKKFLEILKGEMKDAPLKVKVNVVGKQKDLAKIVDKLTNIFRVIIANPTLLDDPRNAKIFNKIIEYSGLEPIDFTSMSKPIKPVLSPMQNVPEIINNQ